MRIVCFESAVLTSGLLALVLGGLWTVSELPASNAVRALRPTQAASVDIYAPPPENSPGPLDESWEPPVAQSRGEDWVYEVFTPPVIYRDAAETQWSLHPRISVESLEAAGAIDLGFGVEAVAIEHTLFPLQLVGFGGAPGAHFGVFENVATEETFIARKDRVFRELDLRVERFEVVRENFSQETDDPLLEEIGSATVVDLTSLERTRLTSRERVLHGPARARLRISETGEERLYEANDEFSFGSVRFRAIRIDPVGGEIDVLRLDPTTEGAALKTFSATVRRVAPSVPALSNAAKLHRQPAEASENAPEIPTVSTLHFP